jgi:hypothetical protein
VNSYTKSAYRYGVDLFYFPDSLAAGANTVASPGDSACPYDGLFAPQGKPGTIVILGHTDLPGTRPRVTEYGIVGFGSDTSRPLPDPASPNGRYMVLYNYPPTRSDGASDDAEVRNQISECRSRDGRGVERSRDLGIE